ncbi:FecCD family ABC transporter permease [Devriesea agamarum]|uniref:FecCD family ABC transporter permease n=1 Tax=Devriesea agamarum TaxID=472569 RepID=UPI00071C57E6|nr:iron chelate uptake ABC transporter family permease subunit [Devriesea agamarum]
MTSTLAPAPVPEQVRTSAQVLDMLHAQRRRRRTRALITASVLTAILLIGMIAEIVVGGSARIELSEIPAAVIGQGEGLADFVIFETRLPRALAAVLVGALFGLSGVMYQRLIGNVLATPDIIGVSAGASTGAVIVIVSAAASGVAVQAGALMGAALAAALIFGLSWSKGSSTYRLVLVGIGVGACFSAITSYLLAFAGTEVSNRAMRWLIGSLSGVQWADITPLVITLVIGTLAALIIGPSLETIRLGDPLAAALGTRVQLLRIAALVLGASLAAIATSVSGPVGFIALVSGPIATRLFPEGGVLPAALVGATLLVLSDVTAQSAPVISPIPTGVLTGLVGAPILMFLLMKRKANSR